MSCSNLRVKTFGPPDPFLKLSIVHGKGFPKLDHHGQCEVTSTLNQTSEPHWENEVIWLYIKKDGHISVALTHSLSLSLSLTQEFTFRAIPSDVLVIDVRDKFSLSRPSASHFMGRGYIPLDALQHQQSL